MSDYAKEQRRFSSAQRHHDNLLPDEQDKPQRVCKCCGEWVDESGFPSGRSHICNECDKAAREAEE